MGATNEKLLSSKYVVRKDRDNLERKKMRNTPTALFCNISRVVRILYEICLILGVKSNSISVFSSPPLLGILFFYPFPYD